MRKVICAWLFVLAIMLFVACGNTGEQEASAVNEVPTDIYEPVETIDPDPEPEIDAILIPSGNEPTDMTIASLVEESGIASGREVVFYHIPEIIYSTTGEENGLSGTFMYTQGTVISFEILGDTEWAIVEESGRTVGISLPRELFNTEHTELDLLEIGESFDIFFVYMGMSAVLEMPVGMFVGLCLDDIHIPTPSPAPDPRPEPTPHPDFFDTEENMRQYDQLMRAGDFIGIYNLVIAYIEDGNLYEQDSAWSILYYLEPILEYIDRVTIIHDTFNNTATIFYRGLYDVSMQHSFVPYTGTRSGLRIMVGFHNNGWIFADRARIRLEDGSTVTITMGRDSTRDVIRGSEIREFVRFNPSSRQLEQLLDSRPYMIRFEENERQLDRTLTESERNALDVIWLFDQSQVPLRHLFNARRRT